MVQEPFGVSSEAVATLLSACASAADLAIGERAAELWRESGVFSEFVTNALIDMYGKCGLPDQARRVFDSAPHRDAVTYTAMINAYGQSGYATAALKIFEEMDRDGVAISAPTVVCALSACSHGGLADEAVELYRRLPAFGVQSDTTTAACVVDALARRGRLDEAEAFAEAEGCITDRVVRVTLLGASRTHRDMKRAVRLAEELIAEDPLDASVYTVAANVCRMCGNEKGAFDFLRRRKAAGAQVRLGRTSCVIDGVAHAFGPADFNRPDGAELRRMCEKIGARIGELGHVPDASWATRAGSVEKRTKSLCYHSERIAIAFSLLHTPVGSPIRLIKNLRVCGDCHAATKLIAKAYNREISVRDASRWHLVRPDGSCSCRDYF